MVTPRNLYDHTDNFQTLISQKPLSRNQSNSCTKRGHRNKNQLLKLDFNLTQPFLIILKSKSSTQSLNSIIIMGQS